MRKKKAIKNVVSSLFLQIIVLIFGLIVPRLIIKSYGSNVNGLISSITQFLSYITLLEVGIGPVVKATLYKPIANNDENEIKNILKAAEKFFRIISVVFLLYLTVLSFIYPLIVKNDFSYFYTFSLIVIISVSTFVEYYFGMTYKLYLQASQKTYVTSTIQIFTYILNIVVIVVLIRLNVSIQLVKLISSFTFILRPIIQNIYIKRKYNIDLKDADSTYRLKNKWDGLVQHIAAIIHNNTDIAVLTFFSTLTEVSVYSVYSMIVRGIKSIIQALSRGIDASFGDMIAKRENDKLNKNFNIYEFIYFTIITIVYSCSIILIVPFIKVYTMGISDVNYIRPLFGWLIVISEFVWSIRLPYSSITLAAGHFKQTRNGAWVEAISNIVISIILVIRYGIIGVAIGTIISMTIRTIEFIYHTNKYILGRSIFISLKRVFMIVFETIIIILISKFISLDNIISYSNWILSGFKIFGVSLIITICFNFMFFKDDFLDVLSLIKRKRKY